MNYRVAYINSEKREDPIYPGQEIADGLISIVYNYKNYWSPAQCYQILLDEGRDIRRSDPDILIYMHTDVVIHSDFWLSRVLSHFDKKDVVAVGLGGATSLGTKDLYRKPYRIENMVRGGYASNQDDAEVHGERFDGWRRVAVLDAFFMAINVKWLKSRGGWPAKHLTHHCLDTWLACEAARDKKTIILDGCSCLHKGGAMSCSEAYLRAPWLQGGSVDSDHAIPHRWLYEEYKDVLPINI